MSLTQIRLNNLVKNPRNFEFEQSLKNITKAVKAEEIFNNKVREYNNSLIGLYSSIRPQLEIKNKVQEDETSHKKLEEGRYTKTEIDKEAETKKELEETKKQAKQVEKLEQLITRLDAGFDDVTRTLINLLNNGVVHHDAVVKALDELDKNGKINNNTQDNLIDEIKKNGDVSTEQLKAVKEVLNYNKATLKEIENLKDVTTKSIGLMVLQKVGKDEMNGKSFDVSYDQVHDEFVIEYSKIKYPFSKSSYQELIENRNNYPTDLSKLSENDLYSYWLLLKNLGETKVPNHTTHDKISFNNQVLGFGRKGALEHNVREQIKKVRSPTQASQSSSSSSSSSVATGQGLSVIILPSSYKQLKNDLALIIASIHAGNDSTEMKNKGLAIIEELKNKGKLNYREETQLQKFFLSK